MNRASRTCHRTPFRWEWRRSRKGVEYQPKGLQEISRQTVNKELLLEEDIEELCIPASLKKTLKVHYYEDKRKTNHLKIPESIITELNSYSFQDSEQVFTSDHKLALFNWQPAYGTLGIFEWNKVHYVFYIVVDKRRGAWYNSDYYCLDCAKKVKGPHDKIVKLTGTYAGKYLNDQFFDAFVESFKNWCRYTNCFTFLISVSDADEWDNWLHLPHHHLEDIDD